DGQRAVSASDDQTLKVWELASGRELRTLTGHTLGVNAVAVTPDGECVVSASDDHTLKVWDLGSEIPQEKATVGVESDVMEFASVLAHAVETFGSRTNANSWLKRPN